MDLVIILMSSSSVSAIFCAVIIWWLWKKGYLGIASSKGPSGPGNPLPTPPLKKSGSPWNIQFATAEENLSIDQGKLRVSFKAGKFGQGSGGALHANPFSSLPAESCVFSYKLFIPSNTDFVKGGKMCGVCIGKKERDCSSGGDWSTVGGSYRLTFDENGAVHPYLYLPFGSPGKAYDVQGPLFKKSARKATRTGIRLWDGDSPLKLRKGQWNSISMRMSLNTPGQTNGSLSATVNGVTKDFQGIRWRDSADIKINMLVIVSFYGGSDSSYNAPKNTYVLLDDFRFSA